MIEKLSNRTNRWVEAPRPTQPMPYAPAVMGVYLAPGEDVEWLWTHTDKGSYVNGYNIIKKADFNMEMGKMLREITNG